MDLEPAKSGKTTLALSIGTFIPPANAQDPGRAVAPDYGFLYIRTVGGPTGKSGPFYGPFEHTTGKTFTTTDIPAGSYASVTLVYATELLDSSFQDIMILPDTDYIKVTSTNKFAQMLNGYASSATIKSVTIKPNKTNTISATLVPFCGPDSFNLDGMYQSKIFNLEKATRRFVRVEDVHTAPGASIDTLI